MDIDVGSGDSDDEVAEQDEDIATDDEREGSESEGQELDGGDDSANDEESDSSEDDEEDEDEDEEDEEEAVQMSLVEQGDHSDVELPPAESLRTVKPEQPSFNLTRSDSPTLMRRARLHTKIRHPKSYTVDVICALPHPVPTHALASSVCMSHVLTGSEDGFVRNYDIFSACNGKTFLTAPQRQHCGFVEGVIKAGTLRSWWDGSQSTFQSDMHSEPVRSPIFSLLLQSDALWGLVGLKSGGLHLYTNRHEAGRIIHTFPGHKSSIASMAMAPDEKSFYSAGWDGDVSLWDLNTGSLSQRFPASHNGASAIALSAVALRPLFQPSTLPLVSFGLGLAPATSMEPPEVTTKEMDGPASWGSGSTEAVTTAPTVMETAEASSPNAMQDDVKSEASYDPLFDDEPDPPDPMNDHPPAVEENGSLAFPGTSSPSKGVSRGNSTAESAMDSSSKLANPFTHTVPRFDSSLASRFSQDVFLTAYFNGQILLWDRRAGTQSGHVGRLDLADKCPPWCLSACWSADGSQIYAGRRNGTIDIWDIRQLGTRSRQVPRILRVLKNPIGSGEVSCVAAFPDGKNLVCGSLDNIRLWNLQEPEDTRSRAAQFKIVTGHHGGQISQILVDPAARFMISASGNRGWFGFGESTRTVLVHEIRENV